MQGCVLQGSTWVTCFDVGLQSVEIPIGTAFGCAVGGQLLARVTVLAGPLWIMLKNKHVNKKIDSN